jgi:hypothetical protein
MCKSDKQVLQQAVDAAILALDDWTHVYAPEYCDSTDVANSKLRLQENGTVWYIANVLDKLRAAKVILTVKE